MKICSVETLFFLLVISLFVGCNSDEDDNKNIPDVSNIKTTVNIYRFEQDLFAIDTNNVAVGIQNLEARYPKVADLFFTAIIGAKQPVTNGTNNPSLQKEATESQI